MRRYEKENILRWFLLVQILHRFRTDPPAGAVPTDTVKTSRVSRRCAGVSACRRVAWCSQTPAHFTCTSYFDLLNFSTIIALMFSLFGKVTVGNCIYDNENKALEFIDLFWEWPKTVFFILRIIRVHIIWQLDSYVFNKFLAQAITDWKLSIFDDVLR